MAKKMKDENFIKSELLWKEENKKKPVYKNWKAYAIGLGVIVIGSGAGLGIYYGVTTNHNGSPTPTITEQDIVGGIGKQNYNAKTIVDSSTNTITDQITGTFIQAQLTGEIKAAFKLESFEFVKVMIGDHEINDDDLMTVQEINAQIIYNYGDTKGAATKLKINVTIDDQQIVDAISATTYELSKPAWTLASTIENEITAEFIKKALEDNPPIYDAFDGESLVFDVNKITVDGNKLTDDNLKEPTLLVAKINYTYGVIANQSTTLNITVNPFEITDQVMWEKIKDTTHSATFKSRIKVWELRNQVTTIIKANLPENYQKEFIETKFHGSDLWRYIDNGAAKTIVTDQDLMNPGIQSIWITFSYGNANNDLGEAELEITLT